MYHHWLLETDAHVVRITLNRPHALNVLTVDTLQELRQIATTVAQNSEWWVVVLQAAGPHFSAGVDVQAIAAMRQHSREVLEGTLADLQDCLDTFEAIPQPIVVRLRGHVIGGAAVLAACCDFRICDTSASFALPEVRLGIPVIMGTQRLTKLVGSAAVKEMILLAETFDAHTAQRWNFVHRVVEPDQLDDAVNAVVRRLLSFSPLALRSAKRIINATASLSLADAQAFERAEQANLAGSHDFVEAVEAFITKREARYRGV